MAALSVSDRVNNPRHAGSLDGAAVGEAFDMERRVVRVGLWVQHGGGLRARWRATTCASLMAYADAACEFLEAGVPPSALTCARLEGAVVGVHPAHRTRAHLVVTAIRRAAGLELESHP